MVEVLQSPQITAHNSAVGKRHSAGSRDSSPFPAYFPAHRIATISALPSPDGPPWFGPKALIVVLVTPATRHKLTGFVQALLQGIAHQRPNLVDGVSSGDLAAQLGVEVFRAGAGRLAGHGEAVAQDDDAECQQAEGLAHLDQVRVA